MDATAFGDGTYGTSDETATTINLHTSSVSLGITAEAVWMQNHVGADSGLVIGNPGADLSFSGFMSTADNLGASLGAALEAAAIANSAIFGSSTAVTVFYVLGGNITRNNKGHQEGSLETSGRDGLTDTTGTTVT